MAVVGPLKRLAETAFADPQRLTQRRDFNRGLNIGQDQSLGLFDQPPRHICLTGQAVTEFRAEVQLDQAKMAALTFG